MKTNTITRGFIAMVVAIFAISIGTGDGYGQGRYSGQYSNAQVSDIIRRLEESADDFRKEFRKEVDRSNLSSAQKRTYKNQADNFEKATNRLRSHFNSQNNWWNSRSQVQALMDSAYPLNDTMNSIGFRRNIERQWTRLRNDVNTLADTYDLPGLEGGGWWGNPGSPGNPGWGGPPSRPPSWATGTFYTRDPSTGAQITLTVSNNGQVTSSSLGRTSYGTYFRETIAMEGVRVQVAQAGNGIRTTRYDNGQVVSYSRTPVGGGGGGSTRPPSWARGTFYGNDPINGSQIVLTIGNDGRVTSRSGRQVSYGTFNNNAIYMEGVTVRVDRSGNGIRTTRMDTGQIVNYRRN